MEAFWHSAGLEMGNRCGGGSRRWFWRRVSSPGEVPVGVFWLDINLLALMYLVVYGMTFEVR